MYEKRYALLALRDRRGRILLQKRDNHAPKNPGCWGFFGGNIEGRETPRDALRREAREELGIRPKFKFFGRYEIREEDGLNEKFLFIAPLDVPLNDLRKGQREGEDMGLFTFDDLKGLSIPDGDWVIHRDLFGRTEKVGLMVVKKSRRKK